MKLTITYHRIGSWENFNQKALYIFDGKNHGKFTMVFGEDFPNKTNPMNIALGSFVTLW